MLDIYIVIIYIYLYAGSGEKPHARTLNASAEDLYAEETMAMEVKLTQKKIGSVMVVGGGISGIQASLDLANSGYYVYLVEKSTAIGGVMSQLDKTFPTNDCSMCILAPKLVECGRHLNIELLTCSEVEDITGEEGNLKVTVRKRPRYIDMEKCTACGDCVGVCPVSIPSEYDQGLATRKAIYKRYPQAIPGAYTIEKKDRPPCTTACPADVNVQGYVALVREGKYKEAIELIRKEVPLPGVLGRVCPHPCETMCRRAEVDEAICIRELKRFVADQVDLNTLPIPEITPKEEKVAIIGSGPSGLSVAHFLALEGYRVTIFEALPVEGGMLAVGIPEYRLPRKVLNDEIEAIKHLGVEIKTNTPIGKDLTIDDLFRQGYKSIYIATGAHKSFKLDIEGEELKGVIPGTDFLRKTGLGERLEIGKKVAVVGGGNTAIDAARIALRLGAEVTILYRRSRKEMPAFPSEVEEAEKEGVKINYLVGPVRIMGENGKVSTIECIHMMLSEPDITGRRKPIPIKDSEFLIEADTVIPAIGQETDLSFLEDDKGIEISKLGFVVVDPETLQTTRPGVFAGGDVLTGPATVVEAIAAGKKAAMSLTSYLKGEKLKEEKEELEEVPKRMYREIPLNEPIKPRAHVPTIPLNERYDFKKEVNLPLGEETARNEASRCLNCGICSECMQCVTVCKPGAIDHNMQEEVLEINVGSVILAPGFAPFDPTIFDTYQYAKSPNVVTSLEFERILSASGPYQGHLVRPSDGKEPKKIAWIQCVGSRDIHHYDKGYCSAVCCTYAIKEAIIAKEHSKEPLDTAIFFMDIRTHGKDFEKYYNRAKDEIGVRFIRSRVQAIDRIPGTEDLQIRYATEDGKIETEDFDMVVLSIGLDIPKEIIELAKRLGIELDHYNFATSSSFNPVATTRPGIYACGVFRSPKDIPETVMEASAAACASSIALAEARNTLVKEKTYPSEKDVSEEEPRIGVFVCHCGINIAGVVNVPEVVEYASTLPNVVVAERNLFTCSQDTQKMMKELIEEHNLNRIVVASCTPRTHEPLFRETIMDAGLNKYLFEMANIRDQCSWVHMHEPERATEKAKDLVRMAVAKARLIKPLPEATLPVTKVGLVIGGGVSGMVSALNLANQGYPVHLVESKDHLGGQALKLDRTWKGEEVKPYVDKLIREVKENDLITVHLGSQVENVSGFVGNFKSKLSNGIEIDHGVVILATGAHAYEPDGDYLYGKNSNVFLSLDLDKEIAGVSERLKGAKVAAFIQCVGSRIPERPYCSKVCCTHSVESALTLKEINPDMDIYILYRDIRTYGEREDIYREARAKGIIFIRFDPDDPPKVEEVNGSIRTTVKDHVLGMPLVITPDILTLATAIVPNDNEVLSKLYKVSLNQEGFFLEAHMKLRPVDFATDGIFLAGLCHYPKPLDESISQAQAASARAGVILSMDSLIAEGIISYINEALCRGCGLCKEACLFGAIELIESAPDILTATIKEALCKGCGACAAICPTGAASLKHFTDDEVLTMVESALKAA